MDPRTLSSKIDILLVDDRVDNLMTLEAVLESSEYNLIKKTSGHEALRYLLEHDCAIILMDVQMPEMDGFETAAVIKQSPRSRDIPIIFLTAINSEERFVHQGYRAGAVDYLSKPFDPDILRAKVQVFADLFRAKEELKQQTELVRRAEHKEREHALAQLEVRALRRERAIQQKYKTLVDGIKQGVIWSMAPNSRTFTFISPSAERILGCTIEDCLSSQDFWCSRAPAEDQTALEQAFANARYGTAEIELEHRFLHPDGTTVWFQTGIRFTELADGVGYEMQGLSVDITSLKKAEFKIKRSEDRALLLAESGLILNETLDYASSFEKLGRLLANWYSGWCLIESFSESFSETIGAEILALAHHNPSLEPMLRKWRHAYPPKSADSWGAGKVQNDGQADLLSRIDKAYLSKLIPNEGQRRALSELGCHAAIFVPLRSRGRVFGALSLVSASPARRFTHDDLALAQDLALRASFAADNARLFRQTVNAIRARDEFLSIASHELKTPLTPLKLQTQSILRALRRGTLNDLSPETVEKMVVSSDRQIERLTRLVDDLLDISRINSGKLSITPEEFDLAEMTRDVSERFRRQLATAGSELSLEITGPIPGRWDRLRIEQVITNLLSNAMRYGAGKPIAVRVARKEQGAQIEVRDHGIGIAKENQSRIFERFERAAPSNQFGGLGLGLYIVRQIIASHGGTIHVVSEPGQGSNFVVEIPLDATSINQPDSESPALSGASGNPSAFPAA